MLCCGSSSWTDRHTLPFPHPPMSNLRGKSSALELSMSELVAPPQSKRMTFCKKAAEEAAVNLKNFYSCRWSEVTWLKKRKYRESLIFPALCIEPRILLRNMLVRLIIGRKQGLDFCL